MPKLILTLLLIIAGFCVNAQTKDSIYKTTHDSTFLKKVKDTVVVPYDSSYYALVKHDSTVKHDSVYKVNYVIYSDHYEPRIFLTTHDSIVSAITPITQRVRHDSLYWKCPPFRKCRWVTTTARHDTTIYQTVPASVQVSHDTTFLEKIFDTTKAVKDSLGATIHDSIFYRNTYFPHTAYKDSIIFWDSFYVSKTTHDTTVQVSTYKPIWGLKIQQDKFVNQLSVAKSIGITAIRPNSISVRDWDGNLGNVVDWKLNGFFTVFNIDWIDNPNEKPYDFVSGIDTVKFKTNFEAICKALKAGNYADVLIIENEPANLGYYKWSNYADASLYLHELTMAVTIAHKYGLKIADGCCHLQLIELIRTGRINVNDGAIRNKALMDGYKNIPLDYVDFHTSYNPGGSYPVPDLKTTIDYYRTYTGHAAICNEYAISGANTTVVNWFITGWKAAQVPIVLPWSGDGVKSDAYNLGTTITDIGLDYSKAIK